MKKFIKILSLALCISMLASAFIVVPSAEDSETVFIDEDFEGTSVGSLPDGWTKAVGGGGLTASVESSTVEIKKDTEAEVKTANKAFNVNQLSGSSAITAKHDFERSSTAHISFDYQMQSITAPTSARPNGGCNGITFYCFDDTYTTNKGVYYRMVVMYVSENVGKLAFRNSAGSFQDILDANGNIITVNKGEWYHFDMRIDGTPSDGTVVYYRVDSYGKIIADGSFTINNATDPNRFGFHCMGASDRNDDFYVDNLYFKAGDHLYTNDFESDAIDAVPAGIDKLGDGAAKVAERELDNNKALYVSYLQGAGDVTVLRNDFAITEHAGISFDYQLESLFPDTGIHCVSFWNMAVDSAGNYGSYKSYYRVGVRPSTDGNGKIVVHDGNAYIDVKDSDGNVVEIERGVVYHFDVSCDSSGDYAVLTYKISRSGKVIAEGTQKNAKWGLDMNRISIQTTGGGKVGDIFYIDNLKIDNGTETISEDFENISLETSKPTISGIVYTGGTAKVPSVKVMSLPLKEKLEEIPEEEKEYYTTKALYVTDTSTTAGPVRVYKTFAAVDSVTAEFDYMLATEESYAANGFAFGGGGTGTEELRVLLKVMPNGDGTSTLKYYNGKDKIWVESSMNNIVPYKWYSIKIVANKADNTAAVYVDGVKVCDAWVRSSIERVDRILFQSNNAAGAGDMFYIDNLKVTTPTVYADEPILFEDDFSGSALPDGYSFNGAGTNSFGDGELTLTGEMRATRNTSYTKSGKFSFSVKTDNPEGLYFGLSIDGDDAYKVNVDELGRAFYQRVDIDVAINTRELIKENEWVDITIDLAHDRNAPYAYLFVDGVMRGHILYNTLSDYVNGIFIGAENKTSVSVKNVKCELSDGVIKMPEREEKSPIVYLPEVVGSRAIYLGSDKTPLTSTLSDFGTEAVAIDKKYTSIGVDLGESQKINAIRLTVESTEDFELNYRLFSVYKSDDNANWEKVSGFTYNHLFENGKWEILFEFSGVASRYVKINYTGASDSAVKVKNTDDNIRAERRIARQWKMAGQNMIALGDSAPEITPLICLFKENEGVEIKTGDSIGLNFGLISPVEAVEFVGTDLSTYGAEDFEVYVSNDNCVYGKVEDFVLSRDVRDGNDTIRFTFDSVDCAYVKVYIKGEGVSISLDDMTHGFVAYSSIEADSLWYTHGWTRGAEGDYYTLPDGTMVMTYIGYGEEEGDFVENCILAKMSTDGGKTWSKSWIILENHNDSLNIMQTQTFWLENGDLGIIYHEKNGDYNRSNLYFRRSYDMGRNWEDPINITEIYDDNYSGMSSGNSVYRLANGRIIFVGSTADYRNDTHGSPFNKEMIWYSDDEGYTWERSNGIVVLPNTACEANIAVLDNGDLLMTMRTRIEGVIYQSISTDGGDTWAQPVAVEGIVSPSSTNTVVEIPATGDVLLIWNDHEIDLSDNGGNGPRKPLTFAVSADHGLTYKNKRNIVETGSSWPLMNFYGRRAYMMISHGNRVLDVEELYYTVYGEKTLADLPRAATPAVAYENGWLNSTSSTMQYSIDGGETWRFCGGSSVQIGTGYSEIMIKDIGTHEYSPSDVQVIANTTAEPEEPKEPQTFITVADTFVGSYMINDKDDGANELLRTKKEGESKTRRAFVKFDTSDTAVYPVSNAVLRLYCQYASSDASIVASRDMKLYATSSNWEESTFNWEDQPAVIKEIADLNSYSFVSKQWIEIDVTDYVKDNYGELLTFSIWNEGEDNGEGHIDFYSSEKSGYEPQLVITN